MKILLADDHAILREGLMQLLAREFPKATFAEAATARETLDCLARQRWDVLVLDIFMPGRSGLDVLCAVRQQYPDLPVLVLSSAPEEQLAVRVLKGGARGYLNKQAAPEELVKAVRKLLAGGHYTSTALAERLVAEIGRTDRSAQEQLSDREYTVLRRLAGGRSLKDIAAELSLSPKTVSTYRVRILAKLHLTKTAELIRYALEHGMHEEG